MSSKAGQELTNPDEETRRQAARALGSIKTEKKAASSRENGRKGGVRVVTEEYRAALRAGQQARRDRERLEKEAQAAPESREPAL